MVRSVAIVLCLAVGLALPALAQPDGERRVALVIGNAAYKLGPLKNPVNDARALSSALSELGFAVQARENVGTLQLIEALRSFTIQARDADVRLFYFAGHGVQHRGRNYLIPTDAEIKSEDDIPNRAADLNELIERLGQFSGGLNVIILDACRNNPFSGLTAIGPDGRAIRLRGGGAAGLARVEAPQGTLIAYATAPGGATQDSENAPNGLYTKHLLQHIATPGLPVEQLFKRVRIAVAEESGRRQVPWENSSLMGDFCFRPSAQGRCAMPDSGGMYEANGAAGRRARP